MEVAKPRKLKTRVGELELPVPQLRNREPCHPWMFARWQRNERPRLAARAGMYFQGVSTRRVSEEPPVAVWKDWTGQLKEATPRDGL